MTQLSCWTLGYWIVYARSEGGSEWFASSSPKLLLSTRSRTRSLRLLTEREVGQRHSTRSRLSLARSTPRSRRASRGCLRFGRGSGCLRLLARKSPPTRPKYGG